MSGGVACKCLERLEPEKALEGSNRPGRLWRLVDYKCNYSKFNGRRYTPSDYSSVTCLRCGAFWRTKSDGVSVFARYDRETEISISPGYSGYAARMAEWGRTEHRGGVAIKEELPK